MRYKSDVRGSLHVDTVDDLIRIRLIRTRSEDFEAKEAVQMRFSQGKRARMPKYKGWPSEVPGPRWSSEGCALKGGEGEA